MASRFAFAFSQQIDRGLINASINGVIASATHRGAAAVALRHDGSHATDRVATGLVLPGSTWLIVDALWRGRSRRGKAPALDGVATSRLARWWPSVSRHPDASRAAPASTGG